MALVPNDIDRRGLVPEEYRMRNGRVLYYFPDAHINLVKIDLMFEAGSAWQQCLLQSAATLQLLGEGTSRHTAHEVAEFMDYRGIIVERSNTAVTATLTVYSLARHLEELVPMLHEMVTQSRYGEDEFRPYMAKRRQQMLTALQKTSHMARCHFFEGLYGRSHPLGAFAMPDDVDRLTVEEVRDFYKRCFDLSRLTIVLGGAVTDTVLQLFDRWFGDVPSTPCVRMELPAAQGTGTGLRHVAMPHVVQNTLRVGRLLPFAWDDKEYARFMVLSTLLGGYFGSRLMSNLREEKGYTYGVNAMTQIFRGSLAFFIVTDVAADKAEAALDEIRGELERLCNEPVERDELELVRTCMLGDFLHSIDGVFERSERFCQMLSTGVDERFTDNCMAVLDPDGPDAVTPEQLQDLACRLLRSELLLQVSAGR
ncbi:MAG: insulinase family protein [Bacteroidales bacterium]|nr:insulinase family protein [Bacteroidales bacterium]